MSQFGTARFGIIFDIAPAAQLDAPAFTPSYVVSGADKVVELIRSTRQLAAESQTFVKSFTVNHEYSDATGRPVFVDVTALFC